MEQGCNTHHVHQYGTHIDPEFLNRSSTVNTHVVSENTLIREILHMLRGISGAIFKLNNNTFEFELVLQVAIASLSVSSLHNILSQLMSFGCNAVRIREFSQRIGMNEHISQVLQSFANAVQMGFDDLCTELCDIENRHVNQQPYSLLQLLAEPINIYSYKIQTLWYLVQQLLQFNEQNRHNTNIASHQTAFILSMLYSELYNLELAPQAFTDQYDFLLKLFSQTFYPYLSMLDDWLFSSGDYLELSSSLWFDIHDEFLVHVDKYYMTDVGNETFWENGYRLKNVSLIPNFLLQQCNEILTIGKSLRMIAHIQKRMNNSTDVNSYISMEEIRKERVSLINLYKLKCREEVSDTLMINNQENSDASKVYDSDSNMDIENESVNHPKVIEELKSISNRYVATSSFTFYPNQNSSKMLANLLEKKSLNGFFSFVPELENEDYTQKDFKREKYHNPISTIIQDFIFQQIVKQRNIVCPYLVSMLIHNCKLMHHLTALRAIYLHESGDVMDVFSNKIFEMIALGNNGSITQHTPLWNIASLNDALQASIQVGKTHRRRYMCHNGINFDVFNELDLLERFSIVTISKEEQQIEDTKSIFDSLRLDYKLDEPLNMIITSDCLKHYNEAFIFHLRIKQAKFCIEQIHWSRNWRQNRPVFHKLQLLLAKLKHFVSNVQQYLMTRVLHNIWNELLDSIAQRAQDFDQVKQFHAIYITRIQDRCLLKKAPFVITQISKMLDICCQARLLHDRFMDQFRRCFPDMNTSVESENDALNSTSYSSDSHERKSSGNNDDILLDIDQLESQTLEELGQIDEDFNNSFKMLLTILKNILARRSGGHHEHLQDLNNRLNFNLYYTQEEQ